MTQGAIHSVLEVVPLQEATVVRFKRRTILEPAMIQEISEQLSRLAAGEGRQLLLLNCAGVESLTSAMLGEFALLHRSLTESGGRLAFCCVEPFLLQVLKVVNLSDRIPIYPDETSALQSLASQPRQ